MGAIPDKVNGVMTYAQRADFRMPWWAGHGTTPNLIELAHTKDVKAWLKAAGMDFSVHPRDVYVKNEDGSYVVVPDWQANRRNNDGAVLGMVAPDFKNVQPGDLLRGFMDRIESEHIDITTMGSMKQGRNIFIGCKLNGDYSRQVGPDLVEAWLMLHTRFDGKGATVASISSVCPVCENTVEMSMTEAARKGRLFSVAHRSIFDSSALREAIEAVDVEVDQRASVFNALVAAKISYDEVQDYFAKDVLAIDPEDLLRVKPDGSPVLSARTRNNLDALLKSYNRGPGALPRVGTAWGAFQAVTNYVDNEASTRDTSGEGEHMARKFTSMYGRGKDVKAAALRAIMARAKVSMVALAA